MTMNAPRARNQQVIWTKMMVLASIINPLINFFLIPYFQRTQGNGAIGASIAMVITELVLAHTSDQHPWFQRARQARPDSVQRDFYVWSDTPDRFAEARVIFKDFETSNWTFDAEVGAYYWHRFYSHQPSLNYDNPAVRQAMFDVVDFWLSMGVDGLRLDAVPYLYAREGTSCENLPETFAYLRDLRAHIDEHFGDRMLLAEANQWPEDAVAYMGEGDMCQMAFHFPLMPRMFMAARQEDRFPIVDILAETPPTPTAANGGSSCATTTSSPWRW